MIGRTVFHLGGGDIQNPLAGKLRQDMHKPQQVLCRIPEAHAAADARLKVRGRPGHMIGHGALILVPDIHHPVELFITGVRLIIGKLDSKIIPQLFKGVVKLLIGRKIGQQRPGTGFVNHAGRLPFMRFVVFTVAQHKNQRLLLARLQMHPQTV